jgi:hypothetical protein
LFCLCTVHVDVRISVSVQTHDRLANCSLFFLIYYFWMIENRTGRIRGC